VAERAVALSRHAWAKVNLFLEVTGRRPDGYHEIDSLIVFAGVGDRLEFRPADDLVVEAGGPFAAALPATADNLVSRAARALAAHAALAARGHITLDKQLPAAAGIGGGSADAAATLEGLAALWRIRPAAEDLAAIAGTLGADVPVCLYGRPALVSGIGEVIARAPPLPPAWLVLVNPGVPLATGAIFAAREGGFTPPAAWPELAATAADLAALLAGRRNDLEPPARRLAPAVGEALDRLAAAPGALLARMSGSGATCFALFARSHEARAAAAALAADRPRWWVAAAPMLHGKPPGHWRG
jgi:4-diphosphocytidyl-2-C-methyl-D-erythritol kinase